MTRRALLAATAPVTVLDAIAGARLPDRRLMWGVATAPFYERRVYSASRRCGELAALLARHGIRPASTLSYLIPFPSLAARNEFWTHLSADPEWIALQNEVRVSSITIYRTLI